MTGHRWFCLCIAVALLLASGCNKRPQQDGITALHRAAWSGDLGQVERLIANGIPVDARGLDDGTALHDAARGGHTDVVEVLVRCGARVDSRDNQGRTPLVEAVESDRRAVVEYLVEAGAAPSLRVAAYLDDVAMAKSLLEKGASVAAKDRDRWTGLHYAGLYGSTEVAKLLVGALANRRDDTVEGKARAKDCLTGGLYQAITNGHEDTAELLIRSAVQMEAFDRNDGMPLCSAARRGSLRLVKLLLAQGANVNASTRDGDKPLGTAIEEGNIEIVETLIAAGADVRAKDKSGCAAMTGAVTSRCTKAIDDAIREKYGDAGPPGNAEADALVRRVGDSLITRMIDLLVAHGAEVNEKDEVGVTPLHYAAAYGLPGAVTLLLAKGADVNAKTTGDRWRGSFEMPDSVRAGTTALHAAAADGDPNTVQLLLAHSAPVDARDEAGCTPLHYATSWANTRVIELLIAGGADVNAQDREGIAPLSEALHHGYLGAAKVLIAAGAKKVDVRVYPVRTYESDGPVAILHAALAGRPWAWVWKESRWADISAPDQEAVRREWVELLLANGADSNERDYRGNTPLHAAILMGSEELADLFLVHGTPVNARNKTSATALHYAAGEGRLRIVSRLLARGAHVNLRDSNGNIPLHGAALHGHKTIVEVLLAHSADVNVKNNWGRTPLDEALRRGHKEIVQLLTAKGQEAGTKTQSGPGKE